jgi:hypothetical protein
MNLSLRLAASTLACLLAASAHAAPLDATCQSNCQWNTFDIDSSSATSGGVEWIDIASGAALNFTFTIANGFYGKLTVADAGFAGDSFKVYNGTHLIGSTSAPTDSYPTSIGLDFDAALANPIYSRGAFNLSAGSYSINGKLDRSALLGGVAYDATVGGLKLEVSPVPEPATAASLLAGLGLLAFGLRRRQS